MKTVGVYELLGQPSYIALLAYHAHSGTQKNYICGTEGV